MRRFFTKKRSFVALAAVAALAIAGAAFAYFTTSGSGTGSAAVGTSSALTIHGTTGTSVLYPGTSETVSLTADNPSSGHQQIGTVTLTGVHACTNGGVWTTPTGGTAGCSTGTEVTSCESSSGAATNDTTKNFWMAPVTENQDLAPGSGTSLSNSGTLYMNDLSSSQDDCKSATLTLSFSS